MTDQNASPPTPGNATPTPPTPAKAAPTPPSQGKQAPAQTLPQRIKETLDKVPIGATLVVTVVLVVFVLAVVLAASSLEGSVERKSQELLAHARHFSAPDEAPMEIPEGQDLIGSRLAAHLQDTRTFANYHANAAREFFTSQYTAVTIATYAAVLAGLLLVPISWTGWKDAKLVLTVPFFLAAGTTVLFTAFPKVYSLEENLDTNTGLYFSYLALEDEILSYYPKRQEALDDGVKDLKPPRIFLGEIEGRLETLRTLAVALDASSVPKIQEVFKAVKEAQGDDAGN